MKQSFFLIAQVGSWLLTGRSVQSFKCATPLTSHTHTPYPLFPHQSSSLTFPFLCLFHSLLLLFFSSSVFAHLSSAAGYALTWLSLWVCLTGQPSAYYSSPALIKEANWNPFNQGIRAPLNCNAGEHGRGGLPTSKWLY